ncbi:nitroreductase family protein [Enterococcus sp. BWM-S5]|uniref:Nitroreductase family protein n=1 Tax=Enterococcus larvae TaxID=2794352 RepID=A0ABS4CFV2_9ENTE|nr:nitroreductase family protein [Enterococcus larvae]MBP1045498.1 nitroreductase family protein [Enterococcus larvae]
MNETMNLLLNRRTYRDFDENYHLPEEDLQQILTAARQAPSWMNGQFYSIFVIQDKATRKQLVDWNPGNPHMLKSSVFLIFVGDLHRTQLISEAYDRENFTGDSIEPVLVATTDASLALGNAVTAADSLGLGSVVVGSIRKHSKEIGELLALPEGMFPLFGLSIGKPIVEMKVKLRLPEKAVVYYEKFTPYDFSLIQEYDEIMEKFAEARETKKWSIKFTDYFASEPTMIIDQLLKMKKLFNS